MGRSKKSQPWGEVHKVKKRPDRQNPSKVIEVEISYQPKKVSKGLKRLIRRDLDQNPQEAARKMAILGISEASVSKRKSKR